MPLIRVAHSSKLFLCKCLLLAYVTVNLGNFITNWTHILYDETPEIGGQREEENAVLNESSFN